MLVFPTGSNRPLCNLFVTGLQQLGVEVDRFGGSAAVMSGLVCELPQRERDGQAISFFLSIWQALWDVRFGLSVAYDDHFFGEKQ